MRVTKCENIKMSLISNKVVKVNKLRNPVIKSEKENISKVIVRKMVQAPKLFQEENGVEYYKLTKAYLHPQSLLVPWFIKLVHSIPDQIHIHMIPW